MNETIKKQNIKLALGLGRTKRMMDKGMTPSEIAEKLKKPESVIRKWIDIINEAKNKKTE